MPDEFTGDDTSIVFTGSVADIGDTFGPVEPSPFEPLHEEDTLVADGWHDRYNIRNPRAPFFPDRSTRRETKPVPDGDRTTENLDLSNIEL